MKIKWKMHFSQNKKGPGVSPLTSANPIRQGSGNISHWHKLHSESHIGVHTEPWTFTVQTCAF